MEKVVKFKTTDRWGNRVTSTRTEWIEPEMINADGTAYRGNAVVDAAVNAFVEVKSKAVAADQYLTQPASPATQRFLLAGLIILVLATVGIGGVKTYNAQMEKPNEYTSN